MIYNLDNALSVLQLNKTLIVNPSPLNTDLYLIAYKSTAEPKRVNKEDYITVVDTIEFIFRGETEVLHPVITLNYNRVPDFNYVYIPVFNRYYYVSSYSTIRNNIWEIVLTVDVLMSYKDGIKLLNAFVDRQENDYNSYIPDDERQYYEGATITTETFSNDLFNRDYCFILSGYRLDTRAKTSSSSLNETDEMLNFSNSEELTNE